MANFNSNLDDQFKALMNTHVGLNNARPTFEELENYVSTGAGVKGRVVKLFNRLRDLRFDLNNKSAETFMSHLSWSQLRDIESKFNNLQKELPKIDLKNHKWGLIDPDQELMELKELEGKLKKITNILKISNKRFGDSTLEIFSAKKNEVKAIRQRFEALQPLRRLDPTDVILSADSKISKDFKQFIKNALKDKEEGLSRENLDPLYQRFISSYVSHDYLFKEEDGIKGLAGEVISYRKELQDTYIDGAIEMINEEIEETKKNIEAQTKEGIHVRKRTVLGSRLARGETIAPAFQEQIPDIMITMNKIQTVQGPKVHESSLSVRLDELPAGIDSNAEGVVQIRGPCALKVNGMDYAANLDTIYINPKTKELFTTPEKTSETIVRANANDGPIKLMMAKVEHEDEALVAFNKLSLATSTEGIIEISTLRNIVEAYRNEVQELPITMATVIDGYLVVTGKGDDKVLVIRRREGEEPECLDATEEDGEVSISKLEPGDKVFMMNQEIYSQIGSKQNFLDLVKAKRNLDDMDNVINNYLKFATLFPKLAALQEGREFEGVSGRFVSVEYNPS